MIHKTKTLLFFLLLSSATMAQGWEYVNLRQYRVKDMDAFTAYVKSAYPFFNQYKPIATAGRFVASGESGRIYGATYFTSMDQFTTFLKGRRSMWDEYSKSPGNLAKSLEENTDGGVADVLWQVEKEASLIPAGYDGSKMTWRKLNFVTVKAGMMDDYLALLKKVLEAETKAGITYTALVFSVVYGAPTNTLLLSLPSTSALDYYTALAARQKARQANPEILAMRRKMTAMTTNTLIDQTTIIAY